MPAKRSKPQVSPNGSPAGMAKSADHWDEFLRTLVEYAGNCTRACELCKITREAVYWKRRNDKEFSKRYDEAMEQSTDALEDEAVRRAFEGVQEGVYYQGDRVDLKTVYSDGLIQFMLRSRRPEKFKDRVSTDNTNLNANVAVEDDDEVMAQLCAKLGAVNPKKDTTKKGAKK